MRSDVAAGYQPGSGRRNVTDNEVVLTKINLSAFIEPVSEDELLDPYNRRYERKLIRSRIRAQIRLGRLVAFNRAGQTYYKIAGGAKV